MFYSIKLGKMRNFRYGMKAISLVEKKFEKPITKIDMANLTMEETAIIIWAGLEHEDKELTPDKVMDLIDEHSNLSKVSSEMMKAFKGAFGIDEDSAEVEVKNAQKVAEKATKENLV